MDSREEKFKEIKSSMSVVDLNNLIVKMRPVVKKAKVSIIHSLHRKIKVLKTKKGADEVVAKNGKKGERLVEEIKGIKKLNIDKVSKYSLDNSISYSTLSAKPNVSAELRGMTRLTEYSAIQKIVDKFRKEHADWKSLSAFLIYKQTGRRFKKTKQISDGVSLGLADSLARKANEERLKISRAYRATVEDKDTDEDSDDEKDSAVENRKAIQEAKRKNRANKPKLNVFGIFAKTSAGTSSSSDSESDSGNESDKVANKSAPVDLLAARLMKSPNNKANSESSSDNSDSESEDNDSDGVNSIANSKQLSVLETNNDVESNSESESEDIFAKTLLQALKSKDSDEIQEMSEPDEVEAGSDESEVDSDEADAESDPSSDNSESSNDSEDDDVTSKSLVKTGTSQKRELSAKDVQKSVKKSLENDDSIPKSSPVNIVDYTNKEMVIKRLNLDNLDADLKTVDNKPLEEIPSILQTETKPLIKDSFFMTMDGEIGSDEEDAAPTYVRQPDSDDDEQLRNRGREMVESVFIGKLSKAKKARQNTVVRDGGPTNYGNSRPFQGKFNDSRNNTHGRKDNWQDSRNSTSYKNDAQKRSYQGSNMDNSPRKTFKSDDKGKSASAIHPSWEASKRRKEQQSKIAAFTGKKTTFADSD